jgi:hypothetical protein
LINRYTCINNDYKNVLRIVYMINYIDNYNSNFSNIIENILDLWKMILKIVNTEKMRFSAGNTDYKSSFQRCKFKRLINTISNLSIVILNEYDL